MFDLYKWLSSSAIGVTMWYHLMLSGGRIESAGHLSASGLQGVLFRHFLSISFLPGKTEQKGKSKITTQEHESTLSHLWLRAQDCWIFSRRSFLSQSAPVCSFWTGEFVRHHPLTKASVQLADCRHHCLLPRHPAHTTLAHQLAFPEKLNCKQMRKQNRLWFPWGWVHHVTRDGGNCTAALMFPGEPISGLWVVSWAPLWRKTTRSLRSH